MKIKLLFLTFVLFVISMQLQAQPGAIDLSFNPGDGANSQRVVSTAIQSDGKIIVSGWFTTFDNTPLNRIARLNSNGSLDLTFNIGTGADALIRAMVIQPDGKIIIGGDFTNYNGNSSVGLARINTDGSFDNTFTIGSGFNSAVYAISLQSDGKIITGGVFTSVNGVSRSRVARLNADGSVDNSFNSSAGANGSVTSTAVQSDGKILIGGSFTLYGSNPCLRFTRLNSDGSFDSGFNTFLGGTSSTVFTIVPQSNGLIYIGGVFTNYNGNPMNRIGRLNSNGAIDNQFVFGQGADDEVSAITVLSSGDIIIAGNFSTYNGLTAPRIAKISSTGTIDAVFDPGTGGNVKIVSISVQPDDKIIIGGMFDDYNGTIRNGVARLYGCETTQPGTISGNTLSTCPGVSNLYSISPVVGADSYSWTLPSGWTGNSDSTSILATTNGTAGTVSVRAFNSTCGYSIPSTLDISQLQAPPAPVCLVTVDTPSTHNIIIWEKPITTLIDSFFVYREVTTNNFSKIASVAYDSLNEYHDYAANPNTTSFKYKVSTLDTCGIESAKSDFHQTIHLQYLGDGNLQWNLYDIENVGNPVTFYQVYRDNNSTGNFIPIDLTIPGGNVSYTDVAFANFPNAKYVVDVNWNISCTPFRTSVNTTRSNLRANIPDGIDEELEKLITIYPNPANEIITIDYPPTVKMLDLKMINVMGQIVYQEKETGKIRKQIVTENFTEGVYTLQMTTDLGSIHKKLLIR